MRFYGDIRLLDLIARQHAIGPLTGTRTAAGIKQFLNDGWNLFRTRRKIMVLE